MEAAHFNSQVGVRVRELRKAKGWTLDALSTPAGITGGYLSQLEKGKRRWGVDHLYLIAGELGVTPGTLLDLAMAEEITG